MGAETRDVHSQWLSGVPATSRHTRMGPRAKKFHQEVQENRRRNPARPVNEGISLSRSTNARAPPRAGVSQARITGLCNGKSASKKNRRRGSRRDQKPKRPQRIRGLLTDETHLHKAGRSFSSITGTSRAQRTKFSGEGLFPKRSLGDRGKSSRTARRPNRLRGPDCNPSCPYEALISTEEVGLAFVLGAMGWTVAYPILHRKRRRGPPPSARREPGWSKTCPSLSSRWEIKPSNLNSGKRKKSEI